MTNHFIHSTKNALAENAFGKKAISGENWTIWHIGTGIGLLGGTFILAVAVFLSAFQYFYGETPHGIWLYAVVLPLWLTGAHCLDKVEQIEKARRIAYCRQHGMSAEECAELADYKTVSKDQDLLEKL